MKKIDYILIFLVFLLGIYPDLNMFIPQWYDDLSNSLYFKSGIGAVDIVLLFMLGVTIYRYINKKYNGYHKLNIAVPIILFFIWMLFEIIRNVGKYGLSAPGEFRFRYLILALPLYISLNFNSFESRKKLAKFFIRIGYFLPLFYIPIIGMMKGWTFGAENRFLNSQFYLGMVYSLTLIFLSGKYNYIKFNKSIIILSLVPFTFFFIIDSHRSAWLAAAVILGLMFYINELKAGKFIKVIPFILILGAIIVPLVSDTGIHFTKYIEERGSAFVDPSADPTSDWRLMMWTAQLERFIKTPILGEGFGGYWTVFIPQLGIVNISPHSYYVQTLVKVGLVGMVLWLVIAFKLGTRLKKFMIDAKSRYNPELPLIILGFCVIITMHIYYIVYSLEYYSLMYLGLAIAVMLDKKYYLNEQ